jgi:hypothetical protein
MRGQMRRFSGHHFAAPRIAARDPHAIKLLTQPLWHELVGFKARPAYSQLHAESIAPLILSFSPKGEKGPKSDAPLAADLG